ncbi:DNA polymerase III subunit gamma/tau [Hydrogenovibrio sp. 3SP14C1]|uniref:DNA polymerase III subunit gamma/tau n=1 Tax=Hydrogenovibrio sp. 3SP14C1 TaxID=3038774 RepID=UPI002417312A|nr:DNA polymerase III subunit gamma/tau [Hydrogenovibrio sp. 3SP14C1]MDG4811767.1 DNA polymerase III subunit gamma/tau [Hydrogenovibrio sp. 3SP14C1]
MTDTVLARKWRPKNFSELVGQTHVMQALSNALDQQRLHHAYLFTGTRGVGKTTIARIFSKALNCEQGITSKPCGVCSTCRSIDEGRFVDLIEVDAASKTKVEDTRELLENVQYAPVQGRYKVYLIDEVHMLSKSSFNALLKTLEEPPEHVKFLLATTDPHKLPITVLSRCLQFNLMRLTLPQIQQHLAYILQQEQVPFEEAALAMIAKSADGSARDSLSILDQAIAYGGGQVQYDAVQAMLGLVDQQFTLNILSALANESADELKEVIQQLALMGVDYTALNAQLIEALHQVSMLQVLGGLTESSLIEVDLLQNLSQRLSAERIQVLYQIALLAKQDMALAPDIRIGFEMSLLRMLAFQPVFSEASAPTDKASVETGLSRSENEKMARPGQNSSVAEPAQQVASEEVSAASLGMSEPSPSMVAPMQQQEAVPQPQMASSSASQVSAQPSGDVDPLADLKARLDSTLGKSEAPLEHRESHGAEVPQSTMPDNQPQIEPAPPVSESYQQKSQPSEQAVSGDVSQAAVAAPAQMTEVPKAAASAPAFEMPDEPLQALNEFTPNQNPETVISESTSAANEMNVGDTSVTAWIELMSQLQLEGMAAELARQSILVKQDAQSLTLSVDPEQALAKTELALQRLEEQVKAQLGSRLIFVEFPEDHWTPAKHFAAEAQARQGNAAESIRTDSVVQNLMQTLNLKIIESSIRPVNK